MGEEVTDENADELVLRVRKRGAFIWAMDYYSAAPEVRAGEEDLTFAAVELLGSEVVDLIEELFTPRPWAGSLPGGKPRFTHHEFEFELTEPENNKGFGGCVCGWEAGETSHTEYDAEARFGEHIDSLKSED